MPQLVNTEQLPRFLSFRTQNNDITACTSFGDALLLHLLTIIQSVGFIPDNPRDWYDADWNIFAHRKDQTVGITLSLLSRGDHMCTWFIGFVDSAGHILEAIELRQELQPLLEMAVQQWPTVREIRWHKDHTTLRDLFQPSRTEDGT